MDFPAQLGWKQNAVMLPGSWMWSPLAPSGKNAWTQFHCEAFRIKESVKKFKSLSYFIIIISWLRFCNRLLNFFLVSKTVFYSTRQNKRITRMNTFEEKYSRLERFCCQSTPSLWETWGKMFKKSSCLMWE